MPSKLRLKRISDRIKQEISEMLVMGHINDPRLIDVYITDVNVDRELSFATIYVSAMGGNAVSDQVLEGLKHASGFLRSTLAKRIALRTFPKLRFVWDITPEHAEQIEKLIDSISKDTNSTNE